MIIPSFCIFHSSSEATKRGSGREEGEEVFAVSVSTGVVEREEEGVMVEEEEEGEWRRRGGGGGGTNSKMSHSFDLLLASAETEGWVE